MHRSPEGVFQQAAPLHTLSSEHGVRYLLPSCAGDSLPSRDASVMVLDAVRQLCDASATTVVDLFCRGVLGKLLRAAPRVVAAQPSAAGEEGVAAGLFRKGLGHVVEAFGRAVPQARGPLASGRHSKHSRSLCAGSGGN